MSVFLIVILIYLAYRFVAGFLVPLFVASRRMRDQFQNMQNRPGENGTHPGSAGAPSSDHSTQAPKSGEKVGEYIDFEEIK